METPADVAESQATIMTRIRTHSIVLGLLMFVGCREAPQSKLPTVDMQLGQKTFTLEVAKNDDSREHGLMQRDKMPSDHGMIFVFDDCKDRAFWMKNTRIPLDIVFLDENARIISIKQMKAYDLSTTPSDGPAKWAIELNEGAAA